MHLTEVHLNDYIDDVLDPGQRAEVDAHIAMCSECAAEIDALRRLRARIGALPLEIRPERDLRAGIRDRLVPQRTIWSMRYRLAAAAVVLIALSSLLTLAIVNRTRSRGISDSDRSDVRLVSRDPRNLEREYSSEVRELEMVLRKNRGALAPATVRILEENLKIIDTAIREAQSALAADPNSDMLVDLLRSAYERKLELLRRAARSSPVT